MAGTKSTKRTTLADLMAAAKVGAIDPSTEVLTAEAARIAIDAAARTAAPAASPAGTAPTLSATDHGCGIPGCRHGSAHPAVSQPDRQVKMACPNCGAVVRLTGSALAKCIGLTCHRDGGVFAPAARRTYTRRGTK